MTLSAAKSAAFFSCRAGLLSGLGRTVVASAAVVMLAGSALAEGPAVNPLGAAAGALQAASGAAAAAQAKGDAATGAADAAQGTGTAAVEGAKAMGAQTVEAAKGAAKAKVDAAVGGAAAAAAGAVAGGTAAAAGAAAGAADAAAEALPGRSPEDTLKGYLKALQEHRFADAYEFVASSLRGGKSVEEWAKEQQYIVEMGEVKIFGFEVFSAVVEGTTAKVPNILKSQDKFLNQLGLDEYELYELVREKDQWRVDSQTLVEGDDRKQYFPEAG